MKTIVTAFSFIITLLYQCSYLHAQTMQLQTNWWQPAGTVNTIVKHPTKNIAFIGGDFTSIGATGGNSVLLDSATGVIQTSFPSANDSVMAVVSDGHDGFFIVGDFTQVGDSLRNHIAHIDSTGQVTSMFSGVGFNALADKITLVGSKLFVSGSFTRYGNQNIDKLAVIDVATGGLSAWNNSISMSGTIKSMTVANNTLYIFGSIYTVNGINRLGAAAFNVTNGSLLSWNPDLSQASNISSCATDSSNIYVGSDGEIYAISLTQSIIKWQKTIDYGSVLAIAIMGNNVYYGGRYYDMQTHWFVSVLGRLNKVDGSKVEMTGVDIRGAQIRSLMVYNDRLYVGGQTASYITSEWGGVGVYDTINGAISWGPIINGTVFCMASTSNAVFVGGILNSAGGIYRSRVAAMELSWGKPTDWSADVNGTVYSMAVADTVVYIGGNFTTVNGQARKNFAAVHIETGKLLPLLANTDYAVRGFLIDGNMLYMCGNFATVNNQLRKGIAQVNRATGEVLSWAPNANGNVYTIAKYNNTIYAGGSFTEIGGATRNYLAALDQNGVANGWNPNVNGGGTPLASGGVNKLLVADNLIFVGGDFDYVGNLPPTGRPVQFNLITGDLTSWRCYVGNTNNDMFIINDNLIIGSKASTKVNVVNKNTGAEKNVIPTITGTSVNAVMALGNTLLVGGSITAVDGKPVTGLAVLKSQFNVSTPTIKNNLSGITVYPNPTAGNVVISNNNNFSLQVAVYDLSGKLVVVPSMCMPRNNMELNLALSPGVYFVSIQSEQGNSMQKLIITD